jgi:hypothetical protein
MLQVELEKPKEIPYDPQNYCAACGHSRAQHRVTQSRTLKDGTYIAERGYCHVSRCHCSGLLLQADKANPRSLSRMQSLR